LDPQQLSEGLAYDLGCPVHLRQLRWRPKMSFTA